MDLINPVVRQWQERAKADPEAFWGEAAEQLPWFRKWDRVFEWNYPNFRWFLNAETNLAHNCLDHHVARGWGGHTAMIYATERGERRLFTYTQLTRRVSRVASALRGLGIGKGRPYHHLHAYLPGSRHADAGRRAYWRHSFGGLRGLRCRRLGGSRARQRVAAAVHPPT